MQWGQTVMLNPSPTTIPLLCTPRSIFRTLALVLVTKFLFFESHNTGPFLRFLRICSLPKAVAVALVRSVSPHGQFGDPCFSRVLFLVTNITIFSRTFFVHFSTFWAPRDHPTGSTTICSEAGRDGDVCWSSSCNWKPVWNGGPPKSFFSEICFFGNQKKPSLLFVCTLVMVQCHFPPTSTKVSWR